MRENPTTPGSDLIQILLKAHICWQPPGQPQQDDITLVVLDVL